MFHYGTGDLRHMSVNSIIINFKDYPAHTQHTKCHVSYDFPFPVPSIDESINARPSYNSFLFISDAENGSRLSNEALFWHEAEQYYGVKMITLDDSVYSGFKPVAPAGSPLIVRCLGTDVALCSQFLKKDFDSISSIHIVYRSPFSVYLKAEQ